MSVSESDWLQRLGATRGRTEGHWQLARVEGEDVDGLEHAVDGDARVIHADAERLHGLGREPGGGLRGQLAERAGGEVEHRTQELRSTPGRCSRPAPARAARRWPRWARTASRCRRRWRRSCSCSQLLGRGPGDRRHGGDRLLELACRVGQGEGPGDGGRAGGEDADADTELAERAGHPVGAARDAVIEAGEALLERGHLRRREVARREDEPEPEVVQHPLSPPCRLLQLLGLASIAGHRCAR
ncbi:MAG: hypothetical protein MZV63_31790 [Marinilabiliales bacterium]|nr:hypothetical protein [Marinilabiliales bacterium]